MMRRRIKSALGRAACALGLHRRLLRDRAIITLFHRVDDRYGGNPISCTSREFAAYCELFRRHFTVVPLSTLLDKLARHEDVGGHLAITFDDGYKDNRAVAAPILLRMGLPACFFIATGFIASTRVPWWDQDASITPEWMDWDDVRWLVEHGFEVGSHTVSHVDLGEVHGDEAREEIVQSGVRLRTETCRPVLLFSYPYGREHQMTESNRALVREAGYRCCLSAFGGTVRPDEDPYHVHRIPISPWFVSPYQFAFEAMLAAR